MILSVIHATRGRPGKAFSTRLDYLGKATNPDRVQYVLVADRDDSATLSTFDPKYLLVGPPEGCPAAYNLGALAAQGDVFVIAADDVVPPRRWDELVLERLGDTSKPKVLAVSDGHRRDRLLPHPILTRARWEQQGRKVFDEWVGFYADADFTEAAYRDGVVVEARDLVFEHQHPSHGFGELDDTYRRATKSIAAHVSYERFLSKHPGSSLA